MRILVMRSSAMGDVALTVPVIRMILDENPDVEITLLTNEFFAPFFINIPRLTLVFPDFKGKHKGTRGLRKLYRELKSENKFDAVADLHSVVRTWYVSLLFAMSGVKTAKIFKGRGEKRSLTKGTTYTALVHTTERYKDVFSNLGLKVSDIKVPAFVSDKDVSQKAEEFVKSESTKQWNIGIAPFAQHALKMWPLDNMVKLIEQIIANHSSHIFLFGGGKYEVEQLNKIAEKISNVTVVAGKHKLGSEIAIISQMNLFLSMDSSNMHLAALSGTPVFSIWGGTHPYAGFFPIAQSDKYILQISKEELNCRPCTIYGKGECLRGDFACMNFLTTEFVYSKINDFLVTK